MSGPVAERLFTVDDYHRMALAGVFRPGERVELIEGKVVEMSRIGVEHASCVDWLNHRLTLALKEGAILGVQNPIQLGRRSEPQPDVAVLRPRTDYYRNGHPGAEDILLAIEVSDTTYDFDRDVKMPLYARQGISESWIVDLPGEAIEVHRMPGLDGYREVQRLGRGQTVRPLAFPAPVLTVDEVLGPR